MGFKETLFEKRATFGLAAAKLTARALMPFRAYLIFEEMMRLGTEELEQRALANIVQDIINSDELADHLRATAGEEGQPVTEAEATAADVTDAWLDGYNARMQEEKGNR